MVVSWVMGIFMLITALVLAAEFGKREAIAGLPKCKTHEFMMSYRTEPSVPSDFICVPFNQRS